MLRHNLSRSVRFLRVRRGWRQRDLAERAQSSRQMVSRVERGEVEDLTLRSIAQLASSHGAVVQVELRWQGARLERLMDAGHAALQERIVGMLRLAGWLAEAEVSFNWYGDRGRCDVVAFHRPTGTLLIVEIKTAIGDVQDLLGGLDVKQRLGLQLARQLGWPAPARVVPCLVIADRRTARRTVSAHEALFARFSHRGRAAAQWLAAPNDSNSVSGILVFETLSDSQSMSAKRLVRRPKGPDAPTA